MHKGREQRLHGGADIGHQPIHELCHAPCKARQHDLQPFLQVVGIDAHAVRHILHQFVQIQILVAHAGDKVAPRRLHGVGAALDGRGCFIGSSSSNIQMLLHHRNGVNDVAKGQIPGINRNIQLFLLLRHGGGFSNKPLHLALGATIAQLQVVQHGVVGLGKALIGVLDALHVRAHFIGIVRHVRDGLVGLLRRCGRVAAQRLQQGCGEAGDGLHVLVRAQTGSLVGVVGVLLHLRGGLLEQSVHAADQLLLLGEALDGLFAQIDKRSARLLDGRRHGLDAGDDDVRRQIGLQHVPEGQCLLGAVVHLIVHALHLRSGRPEVALHLVQRGSGFIQAFLILERILIKGAILGGRLAGLLRQKLHAITLHFDLLGQHGGGLGIPLLRRCGSGKLRSHQLHLALQRLGLLDDLANLSAILRLAVYADLRADIHSHRLTSLSSLRQMSSVSVFSWG